MRVNPRRGPIVVCALYKFVAVNDAPRLRQRLLALCRAQGIKGTLLLAPEGINGTISGRRQAVDALLAFLRRDGRFADIEHKESYDQSQPFYRLKVKLKKEIVTLGIEGVDPGRVRGKFVEPAEWNRLLEDPELVLIDTRNEYEVEVGSFAGAVNPGTNSFREFPDFVSQNLNAARSTKIAMFCTGGIRCEKASSYMLEQGFEEVYQLKGGILNYLEQVPAAESKWQGECFVFDNRVAVDHSLEKGDYDQCHGCRRPITAADKSHKHYQRGVSCPQCFASLTATQRQRFAERQKQIDLAAARHQQHLGSA